MTWFSIQRVQLFAFAQADPDKFKFARTGDKDTQRIRIEVIEETETTKYRDGIPRP